jgi:hypothetical protein
MWFKHLPPVLTISLNRFSFDFERLTRVKDDSPFVFPLELDVKPYCTPDASGADEMYELYSVVIHRGGAHGGHYHAYIRDNYREASPTTLQPRLPFSSPVCHFPTSPTTPQSRLLARPFVSVITQDIGLNQFLR